MGDEPVVAQPVVAYNPTPTREEMRAEFDALSERAVRAEPAITANLQTISQTTGIPMAGLDRRIKKDTDRAFEKYANRRMDHSPHEAFPFDVVRYTYVIEPDEYAHKVAELQQTLAKQGFTEKGFRNTWGDETGYKGINARYETAEGQRIEIQFHTPDSFEANQVTHADYEIERDTTRSNEERDAARQRADATFAKLRTPPDAEKATGMAEPTWVQPDTVGRDQTQDRIARLRQAAFAMAKNRHSRTPRTPAPGPRTHGPTTHTTPTIER